MPEYSVIICTYNRRALLERALNSVVTQNMPADTYEVLVVDNGSSDGTKPMVHDVQLSSPVSIKYLQEKQSGLSHARNTGIAAAQGHFVAFIDDDAVADLNWLTSLSLVYVEDPDVSLVGGKIELDWESNVPEGLAPELLRALGKLDQGEGVFRVEPPLTLGGGNLSARRSVLEELGGFDVRLGRNSTTLLSGEENELLLRATAADKVIYYTSKAVVYHFVPAARTDKQFLRRRAFWQGVSDIRIVRKHEGWKNAGKLLGRNLVRVPYHVGGWLLFAARGNLRKAFLWETFIWTTLGCCYGIHVVLGDKANQPGSG